MKKITFLLIMLLMVTFSYSQIFIDETFNANTMPTGWVPYTVNGNHNWAVGLTNTVNGNNLTGHLAFDDNAAGSTGNRNNAAVASPLFNITSYINDSNLKLYFKMNYFFDTVDSDDILKVLIFNPTNGFSKQIFSKNTDTVGVFDTFINLTNSEITSLQDDIQLVIFYDDVNGSWGWGAGIDSILLSMRPLNNLCFNPTSLTVGTNFNDQSITTTNVGATASGETPAPSCGVFAGGEDVWYNVIVPSSGNLTIETGAVVGSTLSDTVLSVYSGTCGNLTEITCNDDGGTGAFSLISLTGQNPGDVLLIRVFEFNNNIFDEFQISVHDNTPVISNNDCTNPTNLIVGTNFNDQSITTTNVGATASGETPIPSCGAFAGGEDVWYNVIVPSSGNLTIETGAVVVSTLSDTVLSVYSGTCGNLTEIACNDDGGIGAFSLISLTSQNPGDVLLIRVFEFNNNTFDEFQISVYNNTTASTQENNIAGLALYPNPVTDLLNIEAQEEITKLSIYNQIGQLVKTITPNQTNVSINLENLATGIYIVKIEANDKISSKRLIKK